MSKPKGMKTRYKTTNWTAYNAALKARGLLTIWLDKEMRWYAPASGKRGRQQTFTDAAIQFCLSIKCLFGLALRQSLGPVESLLRMAKLDWRVPDFSTISRRHEDAAGDTGHRGHRQQRGRRADVARAARADTARGVAGQRQRRRSLRHQGMPCGHRAARCGGDHPAAKERAAAAICIGRGEGAQRRCAGLQAPGLADMKELELLPPP